MEITKDSYAEERKKLKTIMKKHPECLGHYVYVLTDPTKENEQIFYVGKGQGLRILNHIDDAFKKHELRTQKEEDVYYGNKIERIIAIHKARKKVGMRIVHYCMTEEHAFLVESAIIDLLGDLRSADTQELAELTNKVSGHDNKHGICDIHTLARKLGATKKVEIKNNEKVLLIRITGVDMNPSAIYERVRKAWRLNPKRADKADYIAAYNSGVIIGLYKNISGWYIFDDPDNHTTTRYCFDGEPVTKDEVLSRYLDHYVPIKDGAQNSIMYLGNWK